MTAPPLRLVFNRRARRYILRVLPDGVARVTVPRGGSMAGAHEFAARHETWILEQRHRRTTQAAPAATWQSGTPIYYRGERVLLQIEPGETAGLVRFADQTLRLPDPSSDARPLVERHLWNLARKELPPRVMELAALHALPVRRVSVRNQRGRWGSCSARGTVSLNWRLVQTPEFVRDYIILHELAHLRHMNHSARFWVEVERLCPPYAQAERWLKANAALLRS